MKYLASYPKSGNTWVRAFLAALSGSVDINNLPSIARDNRAFFYQITTHFPFPFLDDKAWTLIRPAALFNMEALYGSDSLCKTHNANAVFQGIPLFPETLHGPSIYLIRDRRKIAASYAYHLGKTLDETIDIMTTFGASPILPFNSDEPQLVREYYGTWAFHVESWEKAPNTLIVRYEDLQTEAYTNFLAILNHLEIDSSMTQVHDAIQLCALSNLRKQELASGFKECKGTPPFFGGDRETLSSSQNLRIEIAFAETMKKYGYLS